MYIPLIKNEEKCAGQLSYGFNIQDKLEGCTHEKKIPYGDLDFFILVIKVNELFTEKRWQILQVFRVFFKGISFVKLTPEATLG